MDAILEFLASGGYIGMAVAAFLAGSFVPFNSEVLVGLLMAAGLDKWKLVVYATIGNVLGGMFNYWVGSLGRMDWIERYLHVKQEKFEKTRRMIAGKGAWTAVFAFLPIIGSVITIVLGFTRASIPITVVSMTLGKGIRYIILVGGLSAIF